MSHYGKTIAGIMVIVVLLAACGPVPPTLGPTSVAAPPTQAPASPSAAPPTQTRDSPRATPPPADTPVPATVSPREPASPDALRITVVYDNTAYDPRLEAAWGFAALIEYRGHTLLFDTGGDPAILMSNMDLLGIDPASIEAVALSHIHGDHVDGLPGLSARGLHPPVYIPPSFSRTFRSRFGDAFELIDVAPGQELSPGIWTTGEMLNQNAWIYEQALVISTTRGLVVLTGCAHPGIVEIVTRAREMMAGLVHLVLGGFHLLEKNESEVRAIIADFHRLGVELAAPTHCTGETAMAIFAADYGDSYVQAGVGRVLVIEGAAPEAAPLPAAVQVTTNLAYVPDGHAKQKLDLYLPGSGSGPFPTLVAFHGGYGDKRDMSNLARYFADRGYAVVAVNFRDVTENVVYPTTVQDAFCALAWVHANAATYQLDPARIAGLGHSLGGTLVATLATVDDPARYMEGCPHPLPAGPLLRAAIPYTGIFDYPSAAGESSGLHSYIVDYLGAGQDQAPELWAEASPITWIDGQEPPFLLVHGGADENIRPENSTRFAAALEAAGVEVQLLVIDGASHNGIVRSSEGYQAVEAFLAGAFGP